MILSLNRWPGVGKLTVGMELADILGARLLDNHTLFNVAITLTDYSDPIRRLCHCFISLLNPDIAIRAVAGHLSSNECLDHL